MPNKPTNPELVDPMNDGFIYYHYHDPVWRRFAMWLGLKIENLAFELLRNVPLDRITWKDHLRWFIEGWISGPLFQCGFDGSGYELGLAVNGEMPWTYMDSRQKAEFIAIHGVPPHIDDLGYADFSAPQLLLPQPSVASVVPIP